MAAITVFKRTKWQRRWTKSEETQIIDYLLATVRSGKRLERPTACQYYEKMSIAIVIPDCTVNTLYNKVRNMKKKYVDAITWRFQTGQRILEERGELAMKVELQKRCYFFDSFEEIYGTPANVVTPTVLHYGGKDYGRKTCIIAETWSEFNEDDIHVEETDEMADDVTANVSEISDDMIPLDVSETTNDAAVQEAIIRDDSRVNNVHFPHCHHNNSTLPILAKMRQKRLDLECQKLELEKARLELEKDRLEFEKTRLEFERSRWVEELGLKRRKIALEEDSAKHDFELRKFEIEMKYNTQ